MSDHLDHSYFDAKFDGLEKLVNHQMNNMTQHIGAVSSNVKRVENELSSHKESISAHGLESARHGLSSMASWLSLGVAAILAALKAFENGHKP